MAALSALQFEEISNLLRQYFLVPLEQQLSEAESLLQEVAALLEKEYPSAALTAQQRISLREKLLPLSQVQLPKAEKQPFEYYFPELQAQLSDFIQQQEPSRLEQQTEARFAVQPGDPAWLRTAKYWKRRLRQLSKLTGNSAKTWSHTVPLQALLQHHLHIQLFQRLQEVLAIAKRHQLYLLQSAAEISALPDRHPTPTRVELLQEIEYRLQKATEARQQTLELLHRQLEAVLGRLYIELEEEYTKAGTVELPAKQLRPAKLEKSAQQRLQQLNTQLQEWKNARLSLCNHWHLQLHLYSTSDRLLLAFEQAQNRWQEGLQSQVNPSFETIIRGLQGVKKTLAQAPLPDAFTDSRQQLRQQVARKQVAAAGEQLAQQDLPGQLQALEAPLQQIISLLPESTTLAPIGGTEPKPVPNEGLTPVQPRETVSAEVLPLTLRKLLQLRNEVQQQLEELRQRLSEMEEMSVFNLDAAHAYWEQHQNDEQKARAIAFEGIDRSLNHATNLQERLRQLTTVTWQELEQLQGRMSKSLHQLSNLENVKSLQMRLFKAKARQRSTTLQEQASQQLQQVLPRLKAHFQQTLSFAGQQQERLRNRLGFQAAPLGIATELSDFLAENEQALQRLPFVYRRLYNIEPLSDELFFIGRNTELETMQEGYRRWVEGKFSPMLISGEKGSGGTSLINIFLKKLPQQQAVVRLSLQEHLGTRQELALALCSALGLPPTADWQDLTEKLRQTEAPTVVVVENLQHLYRRWVGGFELMKDFLELVSLSSKQLLWVCTCSLYTWQYLDKLLHSSETWGRVLTLREFTPPQLMNLILRRHRVSGFKLYFEPSAGDQQNKKFVAMEPEAQQAYLEQKFFQKLSLFAQSNLRLALLYWLRATQAVSKNTVTISTSLNPEFAFLLNMPGQRYFTLHALLLHDLLNARDHARILNEDEVESRRQLQMLHDDGLLLRQEKGYTLNPLLYRQIVNVLKQKNLVH